MCGLTADAASKHGDVSAAAEAAVTQCYEVLLVTQGAAVPLAPCA